MTKQEPSFEFEEKVNAILEKILQRPPTEEEMNTIKELFSDFAETMIKSDFKIAGSLGIIDKSKENVPGEDGPKF